MNFEVTFEGSMPNQRIIFVVPSFCVTIIGKVFLSNNWPSNRAIEGLLKFPFLGQDFHFINCKFRSTEFVFVFQVNGDDYKSRHAIIDD